MLTTDYYKTLGLKPEGSTEWTKKACLKLALQYHPDRNRADLEGEERLKKQ